MNRRDYAFPFRIDATSRQAAESAYAAHVNEMVRQVLLTSPGERADLPEFGCGLRQLIFAPHAEALDSTTQIVVLQALNRWLGRQIEVKQVRVGPPDGGPDEAQLLVEIDYVLIEDQSSRRVEVRVV